MYETQSQSGPSQTEQILCGGTLISSNVILTAAHCIQEFQGISQNFSLTKVRIGHPDLNSNLSTDIKIDDIMIHPGFGINLTLYNDVALLKLSKPLEVGVLDSEEE